MAGVQEQGAAPRAQGPGQRQGVLALLPQSRPRIQPVLQFLPGHECGCGRALQKDALTGHRPTWKMGANTSAKRGKGNPEADLEGASDPFSMFSELNGRGRWRPGPGGAAGEAKVETRKIFNAERKALQVMGLGSDATLEVVKAKYKALVKQHHPDANGGDRSTEDRLSEITKAYNYLKTVVRGAS